MNSKNTQVLAFTTIVDFVKELKNFLRRKYKPLALFERFLSNVTLSNDQTISNMVQVFRSFLLANHEAVTTKNIEALTTKEIVFSNNVMMNLDTIYTLLDEESRDSFWQYLLKIYALVEPNSGAKELLMDEITTLQPYAGGAGADAPPLSFDALAGSEFMGDIFKKITTHLEEKGSNTDNPIEVISDIMKSGVIMDIVDSMKTKVESGEINLNSLASLFPGIPK